MARAPKMEKRHFEYIAEWIDNDVDEDDTVWDMVNVLADAFEQTNPAFDRERFLQACGYEPIDEAAPEPDKTDKIDDGGED